jgi:peptide/nickel transport system permease protein
MFNYLIRRILYVIPIIFGVMLITFVLFYVVQSPDKMARRILGPKVPPQVLQNWLHNRGYDKPVFLNTNPNENLFDSQFFHHITSLATLDLGVSDSTNVPVLEMFKQGAIPSLLITFPALICGLLLSVAISLFLVFIRESSVDKASIILTVALMSIPYPIYIIFFQWLVSIKLSWLPAFGFNLTGISVAKFLALPVFIAVFSGLGSDIRLYRAIFLEEIHQEYIRTAQAKGLSIQKILFKHVLKNGLISLITLIVASLPFLIMGSVMLEGFFGIPGLGNLLLTAIRSADFSVIRADVYLGALLYLFGLTLTDICYAWADPRIRLK